MWPKFLDLSSDECRGMLRRLELESYSNIVGAFRAQGTLSSTKLKILKDLRSTLHISETRHKAEVRRVVNDESLSTIAKIVSGPNSEIEWNREGSRGHTILSRNTSHTALSADDASKFGAQINNKLSMPADTIRNTTLTRADDACNDKTPIPSLITDDPQKIHRKQNISVPAQTNHSESKNRETSNVTSTRSSSNVQPVPENRLQPPSIVDKPQATHLRRKSVAFQLDSPPKPLLITNRKVVKFDPPTVPVDIERIVPKNVQALATETKSQLNDIDPKLSGNLSKASTERATSSRSGSVQVTMQPTQEMQVVRPSGTNSIATVAATPSNGIATVSTNQAPAQILKLIDGNAIIMRPSASTHVVTTKPVIATTKLTPAKTPANVYVSKGALTSPQSYVTLKTSSVDYVTLQNNVRPAANTIKSHKFQTISSDGSSIVHGLSSTQVLNTATNQIISIPNATTATSPVALRGSNIVKGSERPKIVHTVSPIYSEARGIKRPASHEKTQLKYVSKVGVAGTAIHMKPKTVTIHPGTSYTRAVQQYQPAKKVVQSKIVYEPWQDYDPNIVDAKNGYTENSTGNGHYYQSSMSNEIYAEDEIIQEEYITSEAELENVIEMDVDSPGYISDEIIVVDAPR